LSEPSARPARAPSGLFANDRRPALALVVGAALAWIPTLPGRDLWAPDEPRYAEIAKEMVERGDWLVPHLNGAVYPEKPPLFFWLEAASASLLGRFDELAVRLPSTLCSIALLLLTYQIGLDLFGRRAAFFAGAVLGTTALGTERAIRAVIDPTLALATTAALLVYLRGRGKANPLRVLAFGALAGLGCLAKFPMGLLLPALAVALDHVVLNRRLRWTAVGIAFLAAGIALALPAAWFFRAKAEAGGALSLRTSVGEQVFSRAFAPFNHEEPPWYYLLNFPVDFLPWTPFLLLALPCWRRSEGKERVGVRFCVLWFATSFVFLSAIGSKRHIYLYPAFPASALLLGLAIARAIEGEVPARGWARACAAAGPAVALVGAIALAASPWIAQSIPESGLTPVILPGCLLVGVGLATWLAFRRDGLRGALLVLPAGFAATVLLAGFATLPRLDGIKSPAPLARTIASLRKEEPVVFLRVRPEGYRFYSGIPAREAEGEKGFLEALAADPPAIGVTTEKDFASLRSRLPAGIERLASDDVGHRDIVVLGRPRPRR
jgi:4-amino-4-deoxy-L-arabinose transferase-like glycosyltransferase